MQKHEKNILHYENLRTQGKWMPGQHLTIFCSTTSKSMKQLTGLTHHSNVPKSLTWHPLQSSRLSWLPVISVKKLLGRKTGWENWKPEMISWPFQQFRCWELITKCSILCITFQFNGSISLRQHQYSSICKWCVHLYSWNFWFAFFFFLSKAVPFERVDSEKADISMQMLKEIFHWYEKLLWAIIFLVFHSLRKKCKKLKSCFEWNFNPASMIAMLPSFPWYIVQNA